MLEAKKPKKASALCNQRNIPTESTLIQDLELSNVSRNYFERSF
jgi:hypothetical protein